MNKTHVQTRQWTNKIYATAYLLEVHYFNVDPGRCLKDSKLLLKTEHV